MMEKITRACVRSQVLFFAQQRCQCLSQARCSLRPALRALVWEALPSCWVGGLQALVPLRRQLRSHQLPVSVTVIQWR